jgi:hypothetical protein
MSSPKLPNRIAHTKHLIHKKKALGPKEIASMLDGNKHLYESVFYRLDDRRQSKLHELETFADLAKGEIAKRLAFSPENIPHVTKQEKAKALEMIEAEIKDIMGKIQMNDAKAGKLMQESVLYAKLIGDRLLFIRNHLLEHGEYERWLELHFRGAPSTARGYTRIAQHKNWKIIAPKVNGGRLTLNQAWRLIQHGVPEPKEEREERKRQQRRRGIWQNIEKKVWRMAIEESVNSWTDTEIGWLTGGPDTSVFQDAMETLRWENLKENAKPLALTKLNPPALTGGNPFDGRHGGISFPGRDF